MPLIRALLSHAVRRAAADPRVRAKTAEVIEREVKPRATAAARQARGAYEVARDDWRDVAAEAPPEEPLAHRAGRFVGRLRERLRDEDGS